MGGDDGDNVWSIMLDEITLKVKKKKDYSESLKIHECACFVFVW